MTPVLAMGIAAATTTIFILLIWFAYAGYYGSRARRFGYPSRSAYLRAVPQTVATSPRERSIPGLPRSPRDSR